MGGFQNHSGRRQNHNNLLGSLPCGHILRRNCLLKQVSKKRVKYTEQKSCPLFCICVKLGLLQMLSVFDDGVPRKIFGPQVEEVNG